MAKDNFSINDVTSAPNTLDSRNPYDFKTILGRIGSHNFDELINKGDQSRDRFLQLLGSQLDYEGQLAMLDYQNEYNSPEAKSARMKAAGINPDIAGLDGVSDSSEAPSASIGDLTPDMSPLQMATTVQSMVQSMASAVTDFYQNYQSMRANNLDNQAKQLELSKNMLDFATDYAGRTYNPSTGFFQTLNDPFFHQTKKGAVYNTSTDRYLNNVVKRVNPMLYSGVDSNGKPISNASVKKAHYNYSAAAATARKSYAEAMGSFGANLSDSDYFDALRKIAEFDQETKRIISEAGRSQANYTGNYFNAANSQGLYNSQVEYESSNYSTGVATNNVIKRVNELGSKMFQMTDASNPLIQLIYLSMLGIKPNFSSTTNAAGIGDLLHILKPLVK